MLVPEGILATVPEGRPSPKVRSLVKIVVVDVDVELVTDVDVRVVGFPPFADENVEVDLVELI